MGGNSVDMKDQCPKGGKHVPVIAPKWKWLSGKVEWICGKCKQPLTR